MKKTQMIQTEMMLSDSINKLCVSGPVTVNYHQSNDNKMVISKDEKIDQLDVLVTDSMINIKLNLNISSIVINNNYVSSSSSNNMNYDPVIIDIFCNNIVYIEQTGSGDININNVDKDELYLTLTGSGDQIANGQVKSLRIILTGSGDIDTKNLKSNNVNCTLSGSGDIICFADLSSTLSVVGSGDIKVYGNPVIKNTNVTGSGDINFKG